MRGVGGRGCGGKEERIEYNAGFVAGEKEETEGGEKGWLKRRR